MELFNELNGADQDEAVNFLDKIGKISLASKLVKNPARKFSLSLKLNQFEEILEMDLNTSQLDQVISKAVSEKRLDIIEKALEKSPKPNLSLLFIIILSKLSKNEDIGDRLDSFIEMCKDRKQNNLLLLAYFYKSNKDGVLECLNNQGFHTEAALFARNFYPSEFPSQIEKMKESLVAKGLGNLMDLIDLPK